MLTTRAEGEEYKKCRKDFMHFVSSYVYIIDPVKGKIKFNPFDYQERVANNWLKNQFNIIFKPRQMGISWLVAAYAVWKANFHRFQIIDMISMTEQDAIKLLNKCKVIYGDMPDFLKNFQTSNTTEISFSKKDDKMKELGNGSRITSIPASENAGRSEGLSLLIMDEVAFIRYADSIWSAAFPTLSTGGDAILISTANGEGNLFHELWTKSLNKENSFIPLQLKWDEFPGRDKNWYEKQKSNLSPLKFQQEVECDFLQSGSPVFDPSSLVKKAKKQKPIPGHKYYIGCDPAEGNTKSDPSVIQVIDGNTGDQVLTESGKWAPDVFARKIYKVWKEYSGIVGVERNNHGHAVILKLRETFPDLDLYSHRDGKQGFPSNTLTKPIMIDSLEEALRKGHVNLSDEETIRELKVFKYQENGSMSAPSGYHDDKVMALAIAWQMRPNTAWWMDRKMRDFSAPESIANKNYKYAHRHTQNIQKSA